MAQTVSETENVDAVHTVESEVCDELQNEEYENINIDIAQRIPSSETDVDKLKKYFERKMDNSRENDGHVQLMSMEFAKRYYENSKRENAERARDNTYIHLQQINFQNGPWKRTDSRVSIQLFTLKANSCSKEFCTEFNKKHKLLFNYSTVYGLRVDREKSIIEMQLTAVPKEYTKLFIDNEHKWQMQARHPTENLYDSPIVMDLCPNDDNVRLYTLIIEYVSRSNSATVNSTFYSSLETNLSDAISRGIDPSNFCTKQSLKSMKAQHAEHNNQYEKYPVLTDPNLVYACQTFVYSMNRKDELRDIFQLIRSWTVLEKYFRSLLHDRITTMTQGPMAPPATNGPNIN